MLEKMDAIVNEKEFVEELIERVTATMNSKGFEILYQGKIDNGIIKHGIMVTKLCKNDKYNIGAVVYFEKEWTTLRDEEIIELLTNAGEKTPEVNFNKLLECQYIKENVLPMIQKIENIEQYKDTDLFYTNNDCFVILYYVQMKSPVSTINAHMKIRKNIMESLHISEEEMMKCAFENLKQEICIESIKNLLESNGIKIPEDENMPIYVISNQEKYLGSACIMLPEVYEMLSKVLGERYIILPSSIHECLAIEYTEDTDLLVSMVQDINATSVEDEEILSNHIYVCTKEGVSLLK